MPLEKDCDFFRLEKDIELNIIRGKYLNDLFSEEEVDFNGFAK